jgi:hypothetical protein
VSNVRLLTLRAKLKSQEEYLATRKVQDEADKKLAQLRAEREAVEQRMMSNVSTYTAVGTLQASTLQSGAGVLYRLTDPATGRTIVYIRSNDAKYAQLMNQFVGVRGSLRTDERLKMKIITPTDAEPVDQVKVNNTVIATITPPSMLPASVTIDQAPAAATE